MFLYLDAHNIGRHVKLSPFKTKATKEGRHRNTVGETMQLTKIPPGQNGLLRSGPDPRGRASPPPSQLFRIRHPVTPKWSGSYDNDFDKRRGGPHDKYLTTPQWIGCYGFDGSRDGRSRCQPQMGCGNWLARKNNSATGVGLEGSPSHRDLKMSTAFRNVIIDRVDYLTSAADGGGGGKLSSSYSLEDVTTVPYVATSHHHENHVGSKRRLYGSAEDLLDGLRAPQETIFNRGDGFLSKYHQSSPLSSPIFPRPPVLPPLQRKNLGKIGWSIGGKTKRNGAKNASLNMAFDNSDESSSSAAISPSPKVCSADWTNSDHQVVGLQGLQASMSSPHGKPKEAKDQKPHRLDYAPVSAAASWHHTPTDAGNSTLANRIDDEITSVADKLPPNAIEETLVVLRPCPDVCDCDADSNAADAASAQVSMELDANFKKNGHGSLLEKIETGAEMKHWKSAEDEGTTGSHVERYSKQALDAKDLELEESVGGAHICSGSTDSNRNEVIIQVKDQIKSDLKNTEDYNNPKHLLKNSKEKDDDQRHKRASSAAAATTTTSAATSAIIVALPSASAETIEVVRSNGSLKDVGSEGAATTHSSAEGGEQPKVEKERHHLKQNERASKSRKEVVNFLELAESARQQYLQRKRETGRRNEAHSFCPEKSETPAMPCTAERVKVNPSDVPSVERNQAKHLETGILKRDANDMDPNHLFTIDHCVKVGLNSSMITETTELSPLNASASTMMHDGGSGQIATGVAYAAASGDRNQFKQNPQYCAESSFNLQQKPEVKWAQLEGENPGFSSSGSAANFSGNGENTKLVKTKKETSTVDQTTYTRKPITRITNVRPSFGGSNPKPAASSILYSTASTSSSSSSAAQTDVDCSLKNDATQTLRRTPLQTSSQSLKPLWTNSPVPLTQNFKVPSAGPNNRLHLPQQQALGFSGSSEIIPPPPEFSASAISTSADGSTVGNGNEITAGKTLERKSVSTSQIKPKTKPETAHGTTHEITPGNKLGTTGGTTPRTTSGTTHGTTPGTIHKDTLGSTPENKSRTTSGIAPVTTPEATPANTDKRKSVISHGKISGGICENKHEGTSGKRPENVRNTVNGNANGNIAEKLPALASERAQGFPGVKLESSTRLTHKSPQKILTRDVAGKASRLAALPGSTRLNSGRPIGEPQNATLKTKLSTVKVPASAPIVAADSVQTFISIAPQYIHLPPSV